MSLAITQPRDLFRDYQVFVPPKPKPHLKLQLPGSLSALKLDLARLWLTRTPRKPLLKPTPPPEQHCEDDDKLRARTPVFTRPPVSDTKFPSSPFIVPLPVPMPIKLPQLLSLDLTMALSEAETAYDLADQPSVVCSSMGESRVQTMSMGKEGGDARYVSPPSPSRDGVEIEGWEREWTLMRFRGEDDQEDDFEEEDGDEELYNEEFLAWPIFAFDEAYPGDAEDCWSDDEDETKSAQDGQCCGGEEYGDCFV
ncbi:hypothetical protein C0993_007264 [Termitomyces sp. T159_Od127]|nr:hypothetical protein C0993_007264 [Termitomyces sp. T159_Od127]